MFNASRLTLARTRRGMTKVAVAREADLTTRTISAYEAGTQKPSEESLHTLARILRFPPSFFELADIEEIPASAASFRALSRMTASQRDAALGAARIAYTLSDWITERFELPEPNIVSLAGDDPEAAAESLRAAWGLGDKPLPNLVHLLELHGVRVFSLSEESRDLDAFSLWRQGKPYVFLNTVKTAEHSRFDAGHELGHLVLHPDGTSGRDDEHQANQFASALLMPRASVLAAGFRNPALSDLIEAKRAWGVSVMALVYRLHSLDLISEWHYRSLCIELSQAGYRTREPNGGSRETSLLMTKVLASLRRDGITYGTIATDLGLTADEVQSFFFGLALTTVDGGVATAVSTDRPSLRLV